MNLNTFIQLYKEFLIECKQKEWSVEVLIEDTGDYLTLLKNEKGIEVEFYIEVDFENHVKLNDTTNETKLEYGVIRKEGEGNVFAKQVLEVFHRHLTKHSQKRRSYFIHYLPKKADEN